MSKFMSLLCCSADSKDDADDRYTQKLSGSTSNKRTFSKPTNGEIKSVNKGSRIKSESQKDKNEILDEENSVNETDTITNTDEVNQKSAHIINTNSDSNDTTNNFNTNIANNNNNHNNHNNNNTNNNNNNIHHNTNNNNNDNNTNEVHHSSNANTDNDNTTNNTNSNDKDDAHNNTTVNKDTTENDEKSHSHEDVNTKKETNGTIDQQEVKSFNDSDIITSVDPNDSLPKKSLIDDNESDILDLTKLQEGQSFDPETGWLLGKKDKKFGNKKCLILDLDETLVHSSFKYLRIADFVIPVQIDNQVHHVYVIKRPGVDEFLEKVGKWFEVVVFTASVSKYGDPLLDKLDIHNSVHHRLFRDSCYNYQGNFIKNLSQIGRPLSESIIIDNSPASYFFHPQHSIPISSWFSDTHDNELLDLLPFLEDISKSNVDDVSLVLDITL